MTMDRDDQGASSNWWHKLAVGATGATGGAFGLPALAIELPLSTTIMLRSIADIARSEGGVTKWSPGNRQVDHTGRSAIFSCRLGKAAVQAVPLVGAFGGAAISVLFIDHFQNMGRGHFIVRRLERLHGQEVVRRFYEEL